MNTATDVPAKVISARAQSPGSRLASLWRFRAVYPFLFKEITMRKFRQTILGFWWLIIRPLVPAAFAIIVFTLVIEMESQGLPYPIFYFSGFITWTLFQANVSFMPRTMLWMRGIMRRSYFPRLLVPLASSGPPFIQLAVVLVAFGIVLGYHQVAYGETFLAVTWNMLLFPVCLFLAYLLSLAIGMTCSVIALFAKDIVFSINYFVQIMMFLTPVIFPVTFIDEQYRWILYTLNPMATLVDVSRWSLTGVGAFDPVFFWMAVGVTLTLLALSTAFFMRAETFIADDI